MQINSIRSKVGEGLVAFGARASILGEEELRRGDEIGLDRNSYINTYPRIFAGIGSVAIRLGNKIYPNT